MNCADLLLFHEFRIRAVVDNVLSKNRGRQGRVDFFSTNVSQFRIEDKIIAFDPQKDGCLLAQQDEGEYIAILEIKRRNQLDHNHRKEPEVHLPLRGSRRKTCTGPCHS